MNVTTAVPFPEPDPDDYPQTEATDAFISEFTDRQIDGTFGPGETVLVTAQTESSDVIVAIFDGPGDTTHRPVPPSLRPYMGRHPRLQPPPATS